MTQWSFEPWLSAGSFHGLRLLLVGESHYDPDPKSLDSSHTIQVVSDYGIGDASGRTKLFRNAYAAFTGDFDFSTLGGKATFWNSVSYCNYFQRAMWPPGEEPTDEDYRRSAEPFDALLAHIRPDCFVVMSTRLWKGMKNKCSRMAPIGSLNGDDVFSFDVVGRGTPATHISHPSPGNGGFDAAQWHPHIQEFLTFVRERNG